MQLLIFFYPLNRVVWALISSPFLAEFGGLKWTFGYLVASQPSGLPIFAQLPCGIWWAQMDSDHRPHAYQACALTS